MLKELHFAEASDLYQNIKQSLFLFYETFGEAGMECIVNALHIYATSGYAEECCGFDLDFARIFTLAYREMNGYDVKSEYSCLTDWSGV